MDTKLHHFNAPLMLISCEQTLCCKVDGERSRTANQNDGNDSKLTQMRKRPSEFKTHKTCKPVLFGKDGHRVGLLTKLPLNGKQFV